MLNAIPDQDTFYDITDILESQGMDAISKRHMERNGADLDLKEQFHIYELVLRHEDEEDETATVQQIENIR